MDAFLYLQERSYGYFVGLANMSNFVVTYDD